MKQTATAHWEGNLKEGKGTLTTQSATLKETPYSFKARFEGDKNGTNPEELLAAAHAGCFTMQVCANLNKKGKTPRVLETTAAVTLENHVITGVHLNIVGMVDGVDEEDFITIAQDAAENCIMSKALSVPITCEAHIED